MARKQKQKQKQSQKQSVIVNINEKKTKRKRKPRKKAGTEAPPPQVLGLPKVPPIVIQYGEPASLGPAPPAPPKQPSIFAEPVRPSSDILRPAPASFEQLTTDGPPQREPVIKRERAPTPKRLFEEEEDILTPPPLASSLARAPMAEARETRRAIQLSQQVGSDVPLSMLLTGRYNLDFQPRRAVPTREQRERLFDAGRPYKGDEAGVKTVPRKSKT
jgi:hypothetical protein